MKCCCVDPCDLELYSPGWPAPFPVENEKKRSYQKMVRQKVQKGVLLSIELHIQKKDICWLSRQSDLHLGKP